MRHRSLRVRFLVAAGLLIATSVAASVWTLAALSRLSGLVTDTVRESEAVTAATTRLAGALEREDDAVLLVVAGDARGPDVLAVERSTVDAALDGLTALLDPDEVRELAAPLLAGLAAYRRAADTVGSLTDERDALAQYHLTANPLLRRVVSLSTAIRDRHFEAAQREVGRARDEANRARQAVLAISLAALLIAIAVAWRLTATVAGPLRRLTEGAQAIRDGRFEARVDVGTRDELGELAAVFNDMAGDLAEFRRTNIAEVLRAKATLEATLEALPDAVVLLDADGRVQTMNRAAVETLRRAGIDAPATLDEIALAGLDRTAIARAAAGGGHHEPVVDLSRALRVELDGAVRHLLPRVMAVRGPDPDQRGVILLLSDVSDLARLDELRSEFVAVASHELQTPLTTLRMTLLMLQESSGELPVHLRDVVETSLVGVEQLSDTVREFLDLTQIEAGELRLNLEPIDLGELLRASMLRIAPQCEAQRLGLRADVPSGLQVRGDRARLRVVVDNLLSNALKFTPGGGTITVTAARTGSGEISMDVTDTGPGVPAEFRARIFDKFFRLQHSQGDSRSGGRGAGLGLYLCRQVVERHGGRIRCDAGPHGVGARMTVTLPAQ